MDTYPEYTEPEPFNPSRLPARFLVAHTIQDVLDTAHAKYYEQHGISAEDLRGPSSIIDTRHREQTGLEPVTGWIDNVSKHRTETAYLLGNSAVRIGYIQTNWDIPGVFDDTNTSWSSILQYPFKIVGLDQKIPDKKKIERWCVQSAPDSPPLLYNVADVYYARSTNAKLEDHEMANAIQGLFGPEAVHPLDDDESAEMQALLLDPRNDWRIADVS
jgi:hypothetical protein